MHNNDSFLPANSVSAHSGFPLQDNKPVQKKPETVRLEPANKARILSYVKGDGEVVTAGGDWTGKKLVLKQFLRPDTDNGTVVILNGGREPVEYFHPDNELQKSYFPPCCLCQCLL